MARQPRTRRRRDNYQAPAERARQRRREIKPVGQPKSQTGARRERRGGFRGFIAESIGELKKSKSSDRLTTSGPKATARTFMTWRASSTPA